MNKNAVIIAAIIIVAVHALILFLALHPGGTPEKMDADTDTDTVAADAEPAEAKAEAAKPEPDGRNAQPDAPAVPAPA